jgi:hypothetical protein
MSTINNQNCPLCNNPAKYEIFHDPYCKHFTCPSCVEFCIDAHSEHYLKTVPKEFLSKLSARTKETKSNHMFVMREPNASEMKAQPKPMLTMIAETISIT